MGVMAEIFRLAFFVLPSAFAATSPPTAPPTPACNWQCYLDNNPDLANTVGATNTAAAQSHYEHTGQSEGRVCTCLDSTSPLKVCEDDPNWWDSEYGDGGAQCNSGPSGGVVANPDWCTDYGNYSTEARRACPLACGVCGQVVCAADEVSRRRSRPYTCAIWPELCSGTSASDTEFRNTCQTTCRAALHCEADDGGYGGSYGGTNTSDDFCESLVNEYPESCNSESFRRECEQSCTAALTDGLLSATNQQLVPAVGALAAFFQIVISLRLE